MTHIRNDRTSRRRAGATLVLAAATGGLLAAAMAGSPTARADDPYTDILNDVQGSITVGEADYTAAGTDFSTAGDANDGLIAAFAGFDDIFIGPTDYTLLGLTAAGTDADFSGYSTYFEIDPDNLGPATVAGEEALATIYSGDASSFFTAASSDLSGGDYFDAATYYLSGSYADILVGQADTLGALFSAGF
jgi:hypothetical protein